MGKHVRPTQPPPPPLLKESVFPNAPPLPPRLSKLRRGSLLSNQMEILPEPRRAAFRPPTVPPCSVSYSTTDKQRLEKKMVRSPAQQPKVQSPSLSRMIIDKKNILEQIKNGVKLKPVERRSIEKKTISPINSMFSPKNNPVIDALARAHARPIQPPPPPPLLKESASPNAPPLPQRQSKLHRKSLLSNQTEILPELRRTAFRPPTVPPCSVSYSPTDKQKLEKKMVRIPPQQPKVQSPSVSPTCMIVDKQNILEQIKNGVMLKPVEQKSIEKKTISLINSKFSPQNNLVIDTLARAFDERRTKLIAAKNAKESGDNISCSEWEEKGVITSRF